MKNYFLLFSFSILSILCTFPNYFLIDNNLTYYNKLNFVLSDSTQELDGGFDEIEADLEAAEIAANYLEKEDEGEFINTINKFLIKYKTAVLGVFGIATLTMIGVFIYLFIKLGANGDNPQERKKVIKGIFVAAISTGILGSLTTVYALFFFLLY